MRTASVARLISIGLIAALTGGPALATDVTGVPRVVDGDTIAIGSTKIRLLGIDAPEGAQPCKGKTGKSYQCGDAATARVRQLTAGRAVTCKGDQHDQYGRLLAVCSVQGKEINSTLVREGLAWAFVKYGKAFCSRPSGMPRPPSGTSARRSG